MAASSLNITLSSYSALSKKQEGIKEVFFSSYLLFRVESLTQMPQENSPSILLARTYYIIYFYTNHGKTNVKSSLIGLDQLGFVLWALATLLPRKKKIKLLSVKRKRELALGWEAIATDKGVTYLRIVKED